MPDAELPRVEIETLLEVVRTLPRLSCEQLDVYRGALPEMTSLVDQELAARADIMALIGNNPLQVMFDNHANHAAFMESVFSVGDYGLLVRTVPWVYRSYHAHRFSYDYFPVELRAWHDVAGTLLAPDDAAPVQAVYHWLVTHHAVFVELAARPDEDQLPLDSAWQSERDAFLMALLAGDHRSCIAHAEQSVSTSADVEEYYLQVVQPALYEVGRLWQADEISIAQEHLASAIVSRVMAQVNAILPWKPVTRGKVVVSASLNEFHEIGARMLADVLDQDGWNVVYLGTSVPEDDLVRYLAGIQPDILALSVTIPFNIQRTKTLIADVRGNKQLAGVKVMVGGRAFFGNDDLWRNVGADGHARDLRAARCLAASWGGSADHA